jgi:hypothetical protein
LNDADGLDGVIFQDAEPFSNILVPLSEVLSKLW